MRTYIFNGTNINTNFYYQVFFAFNVYGSNIVFPPHETHLLLKFQYALIPDKYQMKHVTKGTTIKTIDLNSKNLAGMLKIKAHLHNHSRETQNLRKITDDEHGFLMNNSLRSAYIKNICMYHHGICKAGPVPTVVELYPYIMAGRQPTGLTP